jgi:hypothetical protein
MPGIVVVACQVTDELLVVREVLLDPACDYENRNLGRARAPHRESGGLRVPACHPRVIDQHGVGAWRELCGACEVSGIDVSGALRTVDGCQAEFLSRCVIDHQAAQGVFPRFGRQ